MTSCTDPPPPFTTPIKSFADDLEQRTSSILSHLIMRYFAYDLPCRYPSQDTRYYDDDYEIILEGNIYGIILIYKSIDDMKIE